MPISIYNTIYNISDDLVISILNKKTAFHKAKKNILPKVPCTIVTNEKLLKLKSHAKDINEKIHLNSISVTNEYKVIENVVKKFNEVYENHGEFVSMYFEEKLITLHNSMKTVLNYYHNIFSLGCNISSEHFENLKIISSLMKSILVEFENLLHDTEQLKEEQILREREAELQNKANRINSFFDAVDSNNVWLQGLFSKLHALDPHYVNNIQKVVNNICSQVTSDNPAHTLGRLHELIQLLQLEDVHLVGSHNVIFNLRKHAKASDLCWALLQQALITQAETQFSMNIDTAVTFASLLAAVCGWFPHQMAGIVGVLHSNFCALLWSRFSPGGVTRQLLQHELSPEEEEYALRRLKGMSRLLAAVLVAHPPPGFESHPQLSPGSLWTLLVHLCRDDIELSFSSEACAGLLEIGGTSMWATYGYQFEKLLVALRGKFCLHGDLSERSLVLMIDTALSKGAFEHRGYLRKDDW